MYKYASKLTNKKIKLNCQVAIDSEQLDNFLVNFYSRF